MQVPENSIHAPHTDVNGDLYEGCLHIVRSQCHIYAELGSTVYLIDQFGVLTPYEERKKCYESDPTAELIVFRFVRVGNPYRVSKYEIRVTPDNDAEDVRLRLNLGYLTADTVELIQAMICEWNKQRNPGVWVDETE